MADENILLRQSLASMTAERDEQIRKLKDVCMAHGPALIEIHDLRQQLAASQARVRELEDWQQIVTGSGTDQETVIRMAASEYTKTAVQCWKDHVATLQATLAERGQEVEKTRVQLAGCLTAAEGHTADHARQGDYGWSVAYQRTLDLRLSYDAAVQEAGRLREALKHINYSRSQWIIGKITNDEYFNCIADGLREGEV